MRTLIAIFALALAGSASAQETHGDARETTPGGLALGVFAAPAFAFEGFWCMPALRVSVALGPKFGVDLDAGRILGVPDTYWGIDHFVAGQLRFIRTPAVAANGTQYWLLGLRYEDHWKLDKHGTRRHELLSAFTVGVGGTYRMRPGARFVSELGFSGGEGYLFYMNLGVQWEPWASRHVKRAARKGRP